MHAYRNGEITPRQQEILDFIKSSIAKDQRPPTYREIGERFDIRSPNGVKCHLKALVRKGYITNGFQTARSLALTEKNLSLPTVHRAGESIHLQVDGQPFRRLTPEQAHDLARQLEAAAKAA